MQTRCGQRRPVGAGRRAVLAETCTTEDAQDGTAVTERDCPVAGVPSESEVVGDDHRAAADALSGDGGRNPSLAVSILAGRRLIENEDGRPRGHGRGDRDQTLRLRRQIAGVGALQIREVDDGQCLPCPGFGVVSRDAEHARSERDFLENGACEELARRVLKHEPCMTRALVHWRTVEPLAVHRDGSVAERNEPHDRTCESRLAGPVLTENRSRGSPRHVEGQAVEHRSIGVRRDQLTRVEE